MNSGMARLALLALALLQAANVARLARTGAVTALQAAARGPIPDLATPQEWASIRAREPKVGAALAPTAGETGGATLRLPGADRYAGVMFVSRCADCVADKLARWDRLQREFPQCALYVVPLEEGSSVDGDFVAAHGFDLQVMSASDDLVRACNPYFTPRLYLFRGRRLLYLQDTDTSSERAVDRVSALLAADPRLRLAALGAARSRPDRRSR